ncbi:MAG: O-antigen ligase family protein [Desulfobacteraceae bacterium]|nr:O-antigen ligase family protein [Desulfobacteraceae bacterium]
MPKVLSATTRYSLYFLLIFTPLAAGSIQGLAISVIHFVTLFALTTFLLEKSLAWSWEWIKTPLDKPILCLLVLCLLSSVFSVYRYTSILALILFFNYLIIFYLIIHTVRTRSQFRQLVYLIIGMAALLSIIGFLKIFYDNPFPWWDYTDFQKTQDRFSSTYGDPNHLAVYMEMAIPLLLGLFLIGFRGIKLFLVIVLTVFLFMPLIFSLSRGGWFGIFTGLLFMSAALFFNHHFQLKRLLLTLVIGFFVVSFIVLSSTPVVKRIIITSEHMGNLARITVWGGMVEMIKDYPLLGTGPGTFPIVYTQYQPPGFDNRYFRGNNDYLQFTSETGLALVPVMAWMIIALFVGGFKKLNNPSRLVRGVTIGAMSGITAILVHSISDFNLHIPANAILFTTLAAIVVSPIPEPGGHSAWRMAHRAEDGGQRSEVRDQTTESRGQWAPLRGQTSEHRQPLTNNR